MKFVKDNRIMKQQIKQFTLEGILVRTWKSIYEAERKTGFSHASISRAVNGKSKSAYGFVWTR